MSLYIASGFTDITTHDLFKIGYSTDVTNRLMRFKEKYSDNIYFEYTRSICSNRIFKMSDVNDRKYLCKVESEFINHIKDCTEFTQYKGISGFAREWFIGDVKRAADILRNVVLEDEMVQAYIQKVIAWLSKHFTPRDVLICVEDFMDYKDIYADEDDNTVRFIKKYNITGNENPKHAAIMLLIYYELDTYLCDIDAEYPTDYYIGLLFRGERKQSYLLSNMEELTVTSYIESLSKNCEILHTHIENGTLFTLENKMQQTIMYCLLQDIIINCKENIDETDNLKTYLDSITSKMIYLDDCDDDFEALLDFTEALSKDFINNGLLLSLCKKNDREEKHTLLEWITSS
jgi:hypothetical protein